MRRSDIIGHGNKTLRQSSSRLCDLVVNVSKPGFVELGLCLLETHGLEGFPDEAAVLLAGITLEGRV